MELAAVRFQAYRFALSLLKLIVANIAVWEPSPAAPSIVNVEIDAYTLPNLSFPLTFEIKSNQIKPNDQFRPRVLST
jgi:hypothetical protein